MNSLCNLFKVSIFPHRLKKLGVKCFYLVIEGVTSSKTALTLLTRPCMRVVTYHRIAKVKKDPEHLCVAPEVFEQHLNFYKRHFEVISAQDMYRRICARKVRGRELIITLDDGYKDNLVNGLALLEKYQCPASIFISTGFIGSTSDFFWDKGYLMGDRAAFLSEDDIKLLGRHPLIEIGAHTVNHARMSDLSEQMKLVEVSESMKQLQSLIERQVTGFAYPFGRTLDFDKKSIASVRACGMKYAFSNMPGLVTESSNIFSLPRINVREWSISRLAKELRLGNNASK